MSLSIVGLGPGEPKHLTRQAWEVLENAKTIYVRTKQHPTVKFLPKKKLYGFDDLYATAQTFEDVYTDIVRHLADLASSEHVIYAVPGDPMVGETTVTKLIAVCRVQKIDLQIVHGISFIEPTLAALETDGITGLQLLDAIELAIAHHPPINPDQGALVAQLYSQAIASNVKLTLMNQYPDAFPVVLVHAAGTAEQRVEHIPLHEIDRAQCTHLTSLYVPPSNPNVTSISSFEALQETIAHLRANDGCPWDREQTHQSLRQYLLEETYEVLEAIDSEDPKSLREELGDLLLQIMLHTQIAIDDGEFYMTDVLRDINAKIVRRHPHVWADADVQGSAEKVAENWQHIKDEERKARGSSPETILDGVPKTLPALARAHEYDTRAARAGFDWQSELDVVAKVQEEIREISDATDMTNREQELGDLLLAVAVWARWMKVNPEAALQSACGRFYDRFTYLEARVRKMGKTIQDMTFNELNGLWLEAKKMRTSPNKDRSIR